MVKLDNWESQSVSFTNKYGLPSTFIIFETKLDTCCSQKKIAVFPLVGFIF